MLLTALFYIIGALQLSAVATEEICYEYPLLDFGLGRLLPHPNPNFGTTVFLSTTNHKNLNYSIENKSNLFDYDDFRTNKNSVILIHGYSRDYKDEWMYRAKDNFLIMVS